jgi:inhibitor of KinA sporulation pathway (predicted exonuclease)
MDLTKTLCIDIETTIWKSAKDKPINHFPEIIEIGVVLVDSVLMEVIEKRSIIVKPIKSKVSKFCSKITKIKQEDVDLGISLEEACRILRVEFMCADRPWIVWGNFDKKMLQISCKKNQVEYPLSANYTNYKNLFSMFHGTKELKLTSALKLINLEKNCDSTLGIDSALNIANIFISDLKKIRA